MNSSCHGATFRIHLQRQLLFEISASHSALALQIIPLTKKNINLLTSSILFAYKKTAKEHFYVNK